MNETNKPRPATVRYPECGTTAGSVPASRRASRLLPMMILTLALLAQAIGTAANVEQYALGRASSWPRAPFFNRLLNSGMSRFPRITLDPAKMGGKPCIRGMRVTVGMILGLLASGQTETQILSAYPYLEPDDIRAALDYAAWRLEEADAPLARAS